MKLVLAAGLALTAIFAGVGLANADDPIEQVCAPLDSGKINTSGEPQSVLVTAPEGKYIEGYCVKAGSEQSDAGVKYIDVPGQPTEWTITHSSGKSVSHYSVEYGELQETTTTSSTTTTTSSTTTSTSVPETSTTESTVEVQSEPPVTTAPTTPAAAPVAAAPPQPTALPSTGTSSWVLALVATMLVLGGSGLLAVRRR